MYTYETCCEGVGEVLKADFSAKLVSEASADGGTFDLEFAAIIANRPQDVIQET